MPSQFEPISGHAHRVYSTSWMTNQELKPPRQVAGPTKGPEELQRTSVTSSQKKSSNSFTAVGSQEVMNCLFCLVLGSLTSAFSRFMYMQLRKAAIFTLSIIGRCTAKEERVASPDLECSADFYCRFCFCFPFLSFIAFDLTDARIIGCSCIPLEIRRTIAVSCSRLDPRLHLSKAEMLQNSSPVWFIATKSTEKPSNYPGLDFRYT